MQQLVVASLYDDRCPLGSAGWVGSVGWIAGWIWAGSVGWSGRRLVGSVKLSRVQLGQLQLGPDFPGMCEV